jgi:hypothetical protein
MTEDGDRKKRKTAKEGNQGTFIRSLSHFARDKQLFRKRLPSELPVVPESPAPAGIMLLQQPDRTMGY